MIKYSGIKRIHFIGIGGAGMSGIAEVLHNMGFRISGSDIADSSNVKALKARGITVHLGHHPDQIREVDTVVYSSAITDANPELAAARRKKIPVIPRAEMLAELMRLKYAVAVAGTHGKTTTTSMIATVLTAAGMDPTYVVGGKLKSGESGAKLGKGDTLVAEADESDGSLLSLYSTVAVITNIEDDHLDYYGDLRHLKAAFVQFANKVPFYGCVILNQDCSRSVKIIPRINKKVITFGLSSKSAVRAVNIRRELFSVQFELMFEGRRLGAVRLNTGGDHNIVNALACGAACLFLGVSFEQIREGLDRFYLPKRRFQILYYDRQNLVVDDYAHHPREVSVTVDLMQGGQFKRMITVFQPHRYSRLKLLMDDFARELARTDILVVSRIYAAGQEPLPGISGKTLADKVAGLQKTVVKYIPEFEDILAYLHRIKKKGDAFLFLSAGDLTVAAHTFARRLEANGK